MACAQLNEVTHRKLKLNVVQPLAAWLLSCETARAPALRLALKPSTSFTDHKLLRIYYYMIVYISNKLSKSKAPC